MHQKIKKNLFKEDINSNDNLFILYNIIKINIRKILIIQLIYLNKVKEENDKDNFEQFLNYFEDKYINTYNYQKWNYYNKNCQNK